MNFQTEVYEDIYSNHKRCDVDKKYLSDTWVHTLREKGHKFMLSELREMRVPGNRVNSWMVDSLFSIDDTAIDLNDSIVATLIQIGESDFGHPRKDICIGGRYFSSLFLRDVKNAAFLIRLIEQSGLKRPRVMEIGGGTGLLMYLLKIYFKEEITLFAVDIPETLLIQEWYLRNCFPDTPHCYKADYEPINFINGGINFINAYVLKQQNVQFDIAINLDSMQEMNKSSVDAYINYIELNISPKGLFLFQNRFGHSTNCVPEPSEYNFDDSWKIEVAGIMNPFDNCNEVEQLRLVLRRTAEREDIETRRLVLRTIWNSFISGLLQNGDPMIERLISLPGQYSQINPLSRIKHIFEENKISPDFISSAKLSLYFSPSFYISDTLLTILSKADNINYTHPPREVILLAEIQYCKELITAINSVNITAIQHKLSKICQSCSQFVHKPISSDFWNSNLAGILFSLGDNQNGTALVKNSLCRSKHPRWVLRSAIIFHRYNLIQEANIALECFRQTELTNDQFIKLKHIELESLSGNADYARCKLEAYLSSQSAGHALSTEIAKTAVKIAAIDILRMILFSDKEVFTASNGKAFFNLLSYLNPKFTDKELANVIQTFFEDALKGNNSYTVRLNNGILKLYLGMQALGLSIIENEINLNSYFDLARIGSVFLKFAYNELADDYFQKSMKLRPGNFMHQEYIGNAYFSYGRYDMAVSYFQLALSNKPYLRHLKARIAYCNLSKEIKQANIFGNFSDLQRYFTLSQSFYEDSPNWK
jgi:putative sugar O-methyltransferase